MRVVEWEHELQCIMSKYIRQESIASFVKEKNQVFGRFYKEIHECTSTYMCIHFSMEGARFIRTQEINACILISAHIAYKRNLRVHSHTDMQDFYPYKRKT